MTKNRYTSNAADISNRKQGVNFLYVIIGGVALYPRMWDASLRPDYSMVTREMRALPQARFVIMAALDCCGTFLAAMGAVHTPGQYQSLLNQALIPCTMATSAVMLRAKFAPSQLLGAATILAGRNKKKK